MQWQLLPLGVLSWCPLQARPQCCFICTARLLLRRPHASITHCTSPWFQTASEPKYSRKHGNLPHRLARSTAPVPAWCCQQHSGLLCKRPSGRQAPLPRALGATQAPRSRVQRMLPRLGQLTQGYRAHPHSPPRDSTAPLRWPPGLAGRHRPKACLGPLVGQLRIGDLAVNPRITLPESQPGQARVTCPPHVSL